MELLNDEGDDGAVEAESREAACSGESVCVAMCTLGRLGFGEGLSHDFRLFDVAAVVNMRYKCCTRTCVRTKTLQCWC